MKKELLFIVLIAFTYISNAQEVELVEEIVDIIDEPTNKNIKNTPNTINDDKEYEIKTIVDDYSLFYLKKTSYINRKCGISKNGKVILPMIFTNSYLIDRYEDKDGNIILGIGEKFGVYNVYTNSWNVPIKYKHIKPIGQNLFSASINNKQGVIDENNEIIIPFAWKEIMNIYGLDNYLMVSINNYPNTVYGIYSVIDRKLTVPCIYSSIEPIRNNNAFLIKEGKNKMNIIDINNKKYFKNDYEKIILSRNGRNYFIVKKNGLMGVINKNEEVIVPIEFLNINKTPYSDGSYLAQNKDGKFGCIQIDGTITVPFQYDRIKQQWHTTNNLLIINKGKCGVIKLNSGTSHEIITCDYDSLQITKSAFIVKKNNKFGLLNNHGKIIIPIVYDSISLIISAYPIEMFKCKKNKYFYIINSFGDVLSDEKYYEIDIVPKKESYYYTFTYMKVKSKNNKYGLIDKTGRVVLEPMFDDIISDSKNLLIVKLDGKYGIYSVLKKKLMLPTEFEILIKENNEYIGLKNNKFYIIKFVLGEPIISPAIEE